MSQCRCYEAQIFAHPKVFLFIFQVIVRSSLSQSIVLLNCSSFYSNLLTHHFINLFLKTLIRYVFEPDITNLSFDFRMLDSCSSQGIGRRHSCTVDPQGLYFECIALHTKRKFKEVFDIEFYLEKKLDKSLIFKLSLNTFHFFEGTIFY